MATILKVPAVLNIVVQAAEPETIVTVPHPVITAPFSVNLTAPVAVLGVMVAVNFTDWPTTEGFRLETSFVDVVTFPVLTTCERVLLVLPR